MTSTPPVMHMGHTTYTQAKHLYAYNTKIKSKRKQNPLLCVLVISGHYTENRTVFLLDSNFSYKHSEGGLFGSNLWEHPGSMKSIWDSKNKHTENMAECQCHLPHVPLMGDWHWSWASHLASLPDLSLLNGNKGNKGGVTASIAPRSESLVLQEEFRLRNLSYDWGLGLFTLLLSSTLCLLSFENLDSPFIAVS